MSATTKPIKDKIPAQAYLLHTICFLDTGSDTAYFPHFHCSSQVVREIIIDIISIGMSKKLIYIVPLFSNMNINAIIMAISIITRGKPYFFLIVRKSFVNSPFISFPPLHRIAWFLRLRLEQQSLLDIFSRQCDGLLQALCIDNPLSYKRLSLIYLSCQKP